MGREVFRLCYVANGWAYFTTQALVDQTGDDWNDAPYECNAEPPYEAHEYDRKRGKDWKIKKVAFESPLVETHDFVKEYVSVDEINGGKYPWLRDQYGYTQKHVEIHAGITYGEFVRAIQQVGGKVFVELPKLDGIDLAVLELENEENEKG